MWDHLVIIMSFLTGFLVIATINLILSDMSRSNRDEERDRLRERLLEQERERAKQSPMLRDLAGKELETLAGEAAAETAEDALPLRQKLVRLSEQSGLRWSVTKILSLMWGGAAIGVILTWAVSGSVIAALPTGLATSCCPLGYLVFKKKQRLGRLQAQLPDCFDLMARVIQSGQSITQAMRTVADEFDAPVGVEFAYCHEQQNLGLSPDFAYRDLARRTGVIEIKIFVLALIVQRETGGNLAALLSNLSNVVRDRFTMRGKIKGLTAEGRLQGFILLALPPGIYGMLLVVNQEYALKLFDHPALIVVTGGAMLLGAICIHRIVNFDF